LVRRARAPGGEASAKRDGLLPRRRGELGFDRSDARGEAVGLALEVLQDDALAPERPVAGEVCDRALDADDRDAKRKLRVPPLARGAVPGPDDITAEVPREAERILRAP